MRVSLNSVAENWAAAVALWALPYLTLLGFLRPEAAQSEVLQWSLLLIAINLGYKLTWDPDRERFVNDNAANAMLAVPERDWRKNYGR